MLHAIKLILLYFASQIIATALVFACYFGYHFISFNTIPSINALPLSLSLLGNIISILFMIWLMISKNYITLNKDSFNPGKPKTALLYILIGITSMVWMNFISELFSLPNWFEEMFAMMKDSFLGVASIVIFAPIFEEMFFRGAIEGHLLEKWKNPRLAIFVSALLFGLIHGNPVQILFAFIFGLILGEVYYRLRSLTPVIILHFINNATSVILMNIYPDENNITDLVGFNNMAIISAVSFVIFVFLFIQLIIKHPQIEK